MASTTKKKTQGRKYYISSELLDSSRTIGFLKDWAERERATFRREIPAEAADKEDLQDAREITRVTRKIPSFSEDGEMSVVEVEMIGYDVENWRYYFIPADLEALEKFVERLGLQVGLNFYDPENCEEDDEAWAEQQIGMPLPEEKAIILQITDGFMLGEFEENCGDPNCESCNPKKKDKSKEEND